MQGWVSGWGYLREVTEIEVLASEATERGRKQVDPES